LKSKSKVSIIILIQIGIIIGSFLTLAISESQISLQGNSINVAGKNRFLSSDFVDEIKNQFYLKNSDSKPQDKLMLLEKNIYLLKNGGTLNGNEIPKLNPEFEKDWDKVQERFVALKTEYLIFKDNEKSNLTYLDIENLEIEKKSFIQVSDSLVELLGNHVKQLSERLIILQLVLLILNVAVHIELIIIIIKIYQDEFKKSQKTDKLATIGELSARISHDMRNPLSVLKMSLELIDKESVDESTHQKIKIMKKAVDRLAHQIDNVLDFVRTKDPTLSKWNLNTILLESIEQIHVPDTITISLPEKNLLINCDKEQFEILFLNLIKNSIDSIKDNGTIKIDSKETSSEIIIKIQDSGSGIPEQYLDQIFDPLVTFKSKGTGLGLASCQNIVKSHHGTINVKNNPTTFTIIIPRSDS
jgi:signal transduction histidine kinase